MSKKTEEKTEELKKPEETLEEAEAEKKKKPGKKRAEKKKKREKGVFTLYKIENDKVARQRLICERCGPGYFMADHGDRYACGHCGFTRYKPVGNTK